MKQAGPSLPLEKLGCLVEHPDPVCQFEVEPLKEDEHELLLRVAARRPRPLGVAEVHRERGRTDGHLAGKGLPGDAVPAIIWDWGAFSQPGEVFNFLRTLRTLIAAFTLMFHCLPISA